MSMYPFSDNRLFWSQLNEYLEAKGQPEASLGEASYWRWAGMSPEGAATMIIGERRAKDAEDVA